MSISFLASLRRKGLFLLIVGYMVFTLASDSSADMINVQVLDAGGTIWSSAANYKLCSSLGQPIIGIQSGTNIGGTAGFWNKIFSLAVDVDDSGDPLELPRSFTLNQNYPNPFNPTTTITYALPEKSSVRIVIYNIRGQLVKTLIAENQSAGYKSVVWNGRTDNGTEVGSGVYFYKITAGDHVASKKMLLLK